jgi:hypothetical protein
MINFIKLEQIQIDIITIILTTLEISAEKVNAKNLISVFSNS